MIMGSQKPADRMLQSIKEFPTPSDISSVLSFCELINQVSYALSTTETMAPFTALLKSSTHF